MLSNNPRGDRFRVQISTNFFSDEVTKKYDEYILAQNGPFKSMYEVLHESIQEFEIPGYDLGVITQTTTNSSGQQDVTGYPSSKPIEEMIESTDITVTFRHIDSFSNYFFLLEKFFKEMTRSKDQKERFMILCTVFNTDQQPCFYINFSKIIFSKFPGIQFTYAAPTTNFKSFQCTFSFSDFKCEFDLPKALVEAYTPK